MLPTTADRRRRIAARALSTATGIGVVAASVTLAIPAHAAAPIAGTTTWTTPANTPITMNLCEGATDPDGGTLQLAGMDASLDAHGTFLSYDPATCLVGWQPDTDWTGIQNFSWVLTDGTEDAYASGSVEVTGAPVPTAPVAVDDLYSTPYGTQLVVPAAQGVFANDSDADSAFSLFSVDNPANVPITLNNDGGFTYSPPAGFSGMQTIKYRLTDPTGQQSGWATVTVEVGAQTQSQIPPTPLADAYTGYENLTLSVPAATGLLANDTDQGSASFHLHASNLVGLVGSIQIGSDGAFEFTPPAGWTGVTSFQYNAIDSDGNVSGFVTATLTILGNAAPTPSADVYTMQSGGTLYLSDAATGVLGNDTDPDGDNVSVQAIVAQPHHGSLTYWNKYGHFQYVPTPGFAGTDTFSYLAQDSHGAVAASATTVTITVTPTSNQPQFPVYGSANENFVAQAYRDFLDREATDQERAAWTAQLNAGGSRAGFVDQLAKSTEWITRTITEFYQETLNRAPDAGGLAYWVGLARNGMPIGQIGAFFYSSDEYFNVVSNGIKSVWITNLYNALLDRAPDAGGLNYWVGVLNGGTSRMAIAGGFYESPESRGLRVERLYGELLGRNADAGGKSYWAGVIRSSGDFALAGFLAASNEYYVKAQTPHA